VSRDGICSVQSVSYSKYTPCGARKRVRSGLRGQEPDAPAA
jgi:hypothetical protein